MTFQKAQETEFYLKINPTEFLQRRESDIHIKHFTDNKLLFDSLDFSMTLQRKTLILDNAIIKDMMITYDAIIRDVMVKEDIND